MLRIQAEALTYDDVSLVPAHSTVLPKDVSLETRLTRDLRIRLPIVSAAMDTVSKPASPWRSPSSAASRSSTRT